MSKQASVTDASQHLLDIRCLQPHVSLFLTATRSQGPAFDTLRFLKYSSMLVDALPTFYISAAAEQALCGTCKDYPVHSSPSASPVSDLAMSVQNKYVVQHQTDQVGSAPLLPSLPGPRLYFAVNKV